MRIILITQNEPFYLKDNLKYLFAIIPKDTKVVGCVVNEVSPFGKKETFKEKTIKTLRVFGLSFFLYYAAKYISSFIFKESLKTFLAKKGVPIIKTGEDINSQESLEIIRAYSPDLLVSILGNQIFKRKLIDLAPKGCINLHTALLPKYRGLMPTFWVLKNNEKFTGVSVFFVDEGIDSGPIIIQKKVEIGARSQAELIKHTKKIGMEAISDAVVQIMKGSVELKPNRDKEKTYYSFPTKEDVVVFRRSGKKFF
ncbi:MAG: formyl transferase [Crocinitomicaceae bacterium]|nr:formyl transferase [Crocinitomicaceae bacterium]|tara:strand:- start:8065 stop:8826 length:762 start_codon:yes stop_codon:yes gene_type:complete